jgi:hypothetical protein
VTTLALHLAAHVTHVVHSVLLALTSVELVQAATLLVMRVTAPARHRMLLALRAATAHVRHTHLALHHQVLVVDTRIAHPARHLALAHRLVAHASAVAAR